MEWHGQNSNPHLGPSCSQALLLLTRIRLFLGNMPLSKATVGLALCAVGAGAVLGHGLLPLLRQGALPAPGTAFALVRYEGWVHNLLAVQLFCCAVVAGIVR